MTKLPLAQQRLQFEDVFQRYIQASLLDDFDPKFSVTEQSLFTQLEHNVVQSWVLSLAKEHERLDIFRVQIDVGMRFMSKGAKQERKPVAQIEASYLVGYRVTDDTLLEDKEALDEFALKSASYHLWPFWCEFVISQA